MEKDVKGMPMRILVLIATPKNITKAIKMFRDGAVPIQYEWNARGTAPSEIMDILGLGNSEKRIVISVLPKNLADAMLEKLKKELKIGDINSGIAFTIPMSNVNKYILNMMEKMENDKIMIQDRKEDVLMNMKYVLIAVIVNPGYSEEVMEVARKVGAKGGTIVHSRRIGNKDAMGFWGMNIQEEKEMIFIVSDNENKINIMQKIAENYGMLSEAQGIVLSMPIDNIIGLNKENME